MEPKQAFDTIVQVVNASVKGGIFSNTAETATVHMALQVIGNLLPKEEVPSVEEAQAEGK